MKKIIILLIVSFVAWQGYTKIQNKKVASANEQQETSGISESMPEKSTQKVDTLSSNNYKCDGRTHCSQMTSCEEATYFLKNCPGVKMDGNNDGVPCEVQWCE